MTPARRMPLIAVLSAGLFALSVAAPAQAGLFDKAKDLLDKAPKTVPGLGQGDGAATGAGLSTSDIIAGLKDALAVGSRRVVDQVSAHNGFNLDKAIHIPLPGNLAKARDMAKRVGLGGPLTDLETRLNHAAEKASARATDLFMQAIRDMTVQDAKGILQGKQDAATQYFRRKMTPGLTADMKPVVDNALSEAGAIAAYDAAVKDVKNVPFVPDLKADLSQHVVQRGLDGIFHYLAREEAEIRKNPARRTTEILKKVFAR